MLEFRLCIKVILRVLDEIEAAYNALYLYFTEIGLLEKIDLDLISLCSPEIFIRRLICYQLFLTVGIGRDLQTSHFAHFAAGSPDL